jgi:hypothetical protein
MTLPAAIVDLCFDDNMDPATAYVALSRVKTADDILIMQAFNITPFTQGSPLGPRLLTKKLRGEDIKSDVEEFLAQEAEQRKAEALRKALEAESKEKQKKAKKTKHNKHYKANLSDQQRQAKRIKDTNQTEEQKAARKAGMPADRKGSEQKR